MPFSSIRWLLFCTAPLLLANSGCQQESRSNSTDMQDTTTHEHTNRLIDQSSPYLLQHAHNPVDWYPWGDEAFDKAKAENKLVLVSIGYSACHWCHVMEHESFEDDSVAAYMNKHFVNIKVDREERPDVDQVYMNAVQLMTGRGGWPLNCFTLPDGRPVYGGTYFPKDNWLELLTNLHTTHQMEPQKFEEYAQQLTQGVAQSELITLNTDEPDFTGEQLDKLVQTWSANFDNSEGGPNRAPKFPIPNNYEFLLKHAQLTGDQQVMGHVRLTLDKMAMGGIYDQIGGGFARYSTDLFWKVPHFEKMLYDNAQLVSLYTQAWQATKDPLYEQTVKQTLDFVKRELTSDEGAFYSALDADSEGEEGKFYVWKKEDVQEILGNDLDLIAKYYNINSKGLWEHGNYILLRDMDDETFAKKNGLTVEELRNKVLSANVRLMERRDERIRPGLDDKSLVSWNAMMVSGYCDAYAAFGDPSYLSAARTNLELLLKKCRRDDGGLFHSYKAGRTTINGYLEDYCFMIEALIDLYQITFEEKHLDTARELVDYTIAHFHDESSGMFFFTSDIDPPLIARKTEVNDNVIPASNSSLAKGLFTLGHLFDHKPYIEMSQQMLNNVAQNMESYPAGYSNWAQLMQYWTYPYYEIAITGKDALVKRQQFGQHSVPVGVFMGGVKDGKLPLLEGKFFDGTTIFVCENKTCQLPVEQVSEALKQMQ